MEYFEDLLNTYFIDATGRLTCQVVKKTPVAVVLEWVKFAPNPLRLWMLYGCPLGTVHLEWQIQIVIPVSERTDQKVYSDSIPKYWSEEFSH